MKSYKQHIAERMGGPAGVHKMLVQIVRDTDTMVAYLKKKRLDTTGVDPKDANAFMREYQNDVAQMEKEWRALASTMREFWLDWGSEFE